MEIVSFSCVQVQACLIKELAHMELFKLGYNRSISSGDLEHKVIVKIFYKVW